MNPLRKYAGALMAGALALVAASQSDAQLSVGPGGLVGQTFDAAPAVSQWATFSFGPALASAITSPAQLDASVQSNSIANINVELTASGVTPPLVATLAQWNSTGHYLQTRANANYYTLLLATLRNDTGSNIAVLSINYDLAAVVGPGTNIVEEIPGHRAYYSLTGATGTWVHIPEFDSVSAFDSGSKAAVLLLGSWPVSAPLYLLWADDNGSAATAGANQEGGYAIDNFAVGPIPQPTSPLIIAQPQSQASGPGGLVTFSVGAIGSTPLFYQWLKNSNAIPGATNLIYAISFAQLSDQGFYSVVVSNSFGVVASSNALLTVNCAMPVAITEQPRSQSISSGGDLVLSVTVTGTPPVRYQWYRGDSLISGATNQTYSKTGMMAGDSAIYSVVVRNCGGSQTSSNAMVGVAGQSFVLIGLTNYVWKYNDSNTNLGTAWREVDYNDSGWKAGRGLLAIEDNPVITPLTNTVLILGALTYYFRTSFVLTNDPDLMTLVMSNCIDDGAVFYLNGIEFSRFNMPALPAVIQFNDLALAANPLGEGVFFVSNAPSALLVQGTNVLAVEVHQTSPNSSDVVFGMQVNEATSPPTSLQISNQPSDIAVEEGHAVTLAVGIPGSAAFFQWFKDGAPIIGAVNRSLTIDHAVLSDSGWYLVQISNVFGVIYSRLALLSVFVDRNAPVVTAADLLDAHHILVSFSEAVAPGDAGNPANYSVTNTVGEVVPVLGVVLTNQTNVVLTTGVLDGTSNFILTAAGIADVSVRSNVGLSAAPVARTLRLVGFESQWQYFDPYPPFDNVDPGPGWMADSYDTSAWGLDAGGFLYSQNAYNPTVPVNTLLGATPSLAAYFRSTFSLPASQSGLNATMRAAVDDGAAFFLNGHEFRRFNMPAGNLSPQTPASAATNAVLSLPVPVPAELFRQGDNLIAVELHQTTANDTDKFFAMELEARAESLLTGPALVLAGPRDASTIENQTATFRLTAVAASTFQWQLNDVDLPGATNAALTLFAPLSLDGAQVRCLCGNGSMPVASANATLHVLRDTARPELLSAVASGENTITLAFSKLLDVATATDSLNYSVSNLLGPSAVISRAVLTNGTNVTLILAVPLGGRYTVVVNDVADTAAAPNIVAPGSAATVAADYFIPMDSAWKYLLISTDESVQAAFMGVSYDDTAWLGPSNALLYVESAALPGPKNTLLSLFADPAQTQPINTYYFRQRFSVPVGATNVSIQLRHIIDDGMVLYLNGTEIYRYNMPVGSITAASQALSSVGDATLLGPFDILNVTNLLGGPNVFAVEVHQYGFGNSDIAMGVELAAHVPGARIPSADPGSRPRLSLTPWGGQFALSWSEAGFALEGAASVTGPWMALGTSSPVFVPRTNGAVFFRLRK